MKKIGLLLLAVVMVAGLAGCPGGGGDDGVTVSLIVIDDHEKDDIFEILIDGRSLGKSNLSATGVEFTTSLNPGNHELRIQFVGATDGDGIGSYIINLTTGALFDSGTTIRNGEIRGLFSSHVFTIVVVK